MPEDTGPAAMKNRGLEYMDIYIVTGFTGTGKTTFLNKYIPVFPGRIAVIENEPGEASLNQEFFGEEALINEMPSGCICCTLAVNLEKKLRELEEKGIEKVFLEPSGVSRLSDIVRVCTGRKERMNSGIYGRENGETEDRADNRIRKITLVDISVFEGYLEDFGEFYTDQIEYADVILLSCIDEASEEEKERGIDRIRRLNPGAALYTGDWRTLSGEELSGWIEAWVSEERKDISTEKKTVNIEGQDISVMTGFADRRIRRTRSGYQLQITGEGHTKI